MKSCLRHNLSVPRDRQESWLYITNPDEYNSHLYRAVETHEYVNPYFFSCYDTRLFFKSTSV